MNLFVDGSYSRKVEYAIEELVNVLRKDDQTVVRRKTADPDVVIGIPTESELISNLRGREQLTLPDADESLSITRVDDTVYVTGSDEQGLMYALLEVADQIQVGKRSMKTVNETTESPDNDFRGIFTFLHNKDCDSPWFHSKDHWREYFDLLAKSRYNSFNLVMAHQTHYLAPPFPFFAQIDEHPEVTVPGLSEEQRQSNLEMLRYISTLAERRGIDFVIGVWQLTAWKAETGHYDKIQESMVEGLEWDNLESYTYHGIRTLLEECPAIKGVQVRTNAETGVPRDLQTEFFSDTIFQALEDIDRDVYLDLRGWRARKTTLEAAHEADFPVRLSMKHWAEFMGGPYQAPDQQPSYSFADFLKYPQMFPVAYQVWSLGSHRIFLWGDPEYARTLSNSLDLGDGVGFEINPPLAQKGYGNESGEWRLLNEEYEYYTWEFERYWLFHLLFGRLSYNADADSHVWMRHMNARFGDLADDVMNACSSASRIITFIIRFNMSDPNMFVFPETDTGGVLDYYLDTPPSDPALIKSFREAVNEQLSGEFTARLDPDDASSYLRMLGQTCLDCLADLGDCNNDFSGELRSMIVDIEALAELSIYHADKIQAARALTVFYENYDLAALDKCVRHLNEATTHWERLVAVTDSIYNDHLVTGPIDNVTWNEKMQLVEEDIERVQEQRRLHHRYGGFERAFDFGGSREFGYVEIVDYFNRRHEGDLPWLVDYFVERSFTGVNETSQYGQTDEFGWEDTDELIAKRAPLVRLADKHLDSTRRDTNQPTGWDDLGAYENMLYADYIAGTEAATFTTEISPGEYEITVILADRSENPTEHGPMSISINENTVASDLIVPTEEIIDVTSTVQLDRDYVSLTFDSSDGSAWIATGLVIRPVKPMISHTPQRTFKPEKQQEIVASVTCPRALQEVTLCLECRDGTVRRIHMTETADKIYRADVPNELLGENTRIKYWFWATTVDGQPSRLPDRDTDNESFELLSARPDSRPRIDHDPVPSSRQGEPIQIEATVTSELSIDSVRLHYRYTNQYYDYVSVEMERAQSTRSGDDRYVAQIPADYVVQKWDIMYYIEAVDEGGNGTFEPQSKPRRNPIETIPYNVIEVNR